MRRPATVTVNRSRRHPLATAALAAVLFGSLAGSAGAHAFATARASGVGFTVFPRRFAQHDLVTIAVSSKPAVCTLSVRYADGRTQPDLNPAVVQSGHAKWRFRVLNDAAPGRASVNASCRGAGSAHRSVLVVGSVIPARIVVEKTGWTTRQYPWGSGVASYGVILKNASSTQDAMSVYTLVNFVGPDNHLVGSAGTTIQGIPAGAQFALGGDLTFPRSIPPIARLEIVVEIGKRQPHSLHMPSIANLYIEPSLLDTNYVGAVDGEISNDVSSLVLQNAQLSAVVFDGDGNILGGGSGFAGGTLPPNARQFFKIQGGFSAVPMSRAASAMVSATGMYWNP
jgi:hypothetical protein